VESSTDHFSPILIYPLFVVILSMLPLSGVMVSIFKIKYVSDRDDNIFEILAIASALVSDSLYWFKLVPAYVVIACEMHARWIAPKVERAYLVIACEMHARWIAPKVESSTYHFSPMIYPLFVLILSMLPLSGVMVSTFKIKYVSDRDDNIFKSTQSLLARLGLCIGLSLFQLILR
jgi:hypothetical protein